MLRVIYRAYERALAKYPFLTQTSSAGVLAAIADVLTQSFVEKCWQNVGFNPARTIRFSSIILFWVAPITYRWFLLLEKLKGETKLLPLKRMIIDQSLVAPLLTFSFITNLRMLEGNSSYEALEKAKKDIVPVMKTNYQIWPLAQLINFYLLPLRYRLIFVQFVGLFWNMYLSYVTQIEKKKKKADKIR
uniref:Mitochondrial inner membrane protein Mpv17 n=1 Tax=Onchocerca volvulus TaxID=6282 RepID=A0A8R1XWF8_ONCVO